MKENNIEEEIKRAIDKFSDNKDKNSAILIVENFILGNYILIGGRTNIVKDSLRYILSDYKRVIKENEILKEEKEQAWEEWNNLEQGSYEIEQKLKQQIKQLEKENFDLKDRLSWRIIYCQELEKDLFENCENFVISKDRVKEQIKKYAKLSDDFYSKWKKLSPFNEDYKNLKDKCMCCDAIVDVLQKLLKG